MSVQRQIEHDGAGPAGEEGRQRRLSQPREPDSHGCTGPHQHQRFGEAGIQIEGSGHGARDLRHFQRVREAGAEVIAGRQTYDYLICVATGRVIEFDSEKLKALREEICREHGFSTLSHQFHIFGLSPEAQQAANESTDGK